MKSKPLLPSCLEALKNASEDLAQLLQLSEITIRRQISGLNGVSQRSNDDKEMVARWTKLYNYQHECLKGNLIDSSVQAVKMLKLSEQKFV